MMMSMRLLFLAFLFIEESFEWFFLMDIFYGIFIYYIYDLGLVCIFFCMFEYRHQRKYQSQKQKYLDEIICSANFYRLCTRTYYTDSITDTQERCSNDPQKSEIEERIVFFETKISDDKVFEFETHISTQKDKHTH